MQEIPNDGLIRFTGVFNRDILLLTDPDSLAEVLVHKPYDYQKPSGVRSLLRIILGNGLIVTEGDEHRFQRKNTTPAFSFRHIKELYPIFWSKAGEMSDCIAADISESSRFQSNEKEKESEGVIEVNEWANKVTLDIIGLACLGRNFNTLKDSNDELTKNYGMIVEPTTEKTAYFLAHLIFPRNLIAMLPWHLNQVLSDAMSTLRSICQKLVLDKKELVKSESEEYVDILSLLIKSNNFGDDMLVDHLLTFLAAG